MRICLLWVVKVLAGLLLAATLCFVVAMIAFFTIVPSPCDPEPVPSTAAARVEKYRAWVGQTPGPLLDAHCLEETAGGETVPDFLGPSDYWGYCALKIDPATWPHWRTRLVATGSQLSGDGYARPRGAAPWWIPPERYPLMEEYELSGLTSRQHGRVVADPSRGMIYISTSTM